MSNRRYSIRRTNLKTVSTPGHASLVILRGSHTWSLGRDFYLAVGENMSGSAMGFLETILVVDDNEHVLDLVVTVLRRANFRVLSADSGPHAIELSDRTDETIHMLLSDIDMPAMSGPDLGEALKKSRPNIHVMLMSGGGEQGNLLILNYGWAYIQKPFVPMKLVKMVTEVLHSPDRSQLGGHEFDSRKDSR